VLLYKHARIIGVISTKMINSEIDIRIIYKKSLLIHFKKHVIGSVSNINKLEWYVEERMLGF
jgi:hypothetical protein